VKLLNNRYRIVDNPILKNGMLLLDSFIFGVFRVQLELLSHEL